MKDSIKFSKEGWLGEVHIAYKISNRLAASLFTETMEGRRYWNDGLKCWEKIPRNLEKFFKKKGIKDLYTEMIPDRVLDTQEQRKQDQRFSV